MDKESAITILETQKAKIDDPQHDNNEAWVTYTCDLLKEFLGDKSHQYIALTEFSFTVYMSDEYAGEQSNRAAEYKGLKVKQVIDNAIATINQFGLYEPPKTGFLVSLPKSLIVTIIIAIIGATFSAGLYAGYIRFDLKKLELHEENKTLQERLTFISDSLVRDANAEESN